jgi:hypothetical protein
MTLFSQSIAILAKNSNSQRIKKFNVVLRGLWNEWLCVVMVTVENGVFCPVFSPQWFSELLNFALIQVKKLVPKIDKLSQLSRVFLRLHSFFKSSYILVYPCASTLTSFCIVAPNHYFDIVIFFIFFFFLCKSFFFIIADPLISVFSHVMLICV